MRSTTLSLLLLSLSLGLGGCIHEAGSAADQLRDDDGKGDDGDGPGCGDDDDGGVVCTAEVRVPDGVCADGDACDPDCVACPEIWSPRDGYCDRDDVCAQRNDEDCVDPLVCPTIAYPEDGVCTGGGEDECASLGDPDCWACPAIAYPENGVCDDSSWCSRRADPDCDKDDGTVCPAIAYESDGKCDASDPCGAYSDPDCQGVPFPGPVE